MKRFTERCHRIGRAALLTLVSAAVASCATSAPSVSAASPEAIEALIWEKELAIFAGRGDGDISYYIDVASDHYLGWPPVLPAPTNLDTLKASADQSIALRGEKIESTKTGFTMHGDTALMYFVNHRTRLGEGFADGDARNVDQYYENIHVWHREDGDWKLIGGFARLLDAPRAE